MIESNWAILSIAPTIVSPTASYI